jgi:L-2-hydroxyglutarate oxidase LhgO
VVGMRDDERPVRRSAVTNDCDFDAAVVGAGAVGLAVGYALALRGKSVVILEASPGIGQGISSRNSEVVHAGLYYPTGSLRANLCVGGRRRLYRFLETHGLAHEKCGKLIVAADEAEIPRLEALAEQGARNGVEGLEWLTGRQAMALEPQLSAVAALLSTQTGIVDSHGYMLALLGEIEARGGAVALQTPFLSARPIATGGFAVRAGGDDPADFSASSLVISAGLGAQAAAMAIAGYRIETIPRLHLGKGVYFKLTGPAPFEKLVYPLPIPGALGTHYTRDLGGQGRFGPDLEFTSAETYDIDPARAEGFEHAIRRYWPALPLDALQPDYAAIRPKLHGPGEAQPDFRIDGPERHGLAGLVALFGIESPGLTSSLAIGETVAALLVAADQGNGGASVDATEAPVTRSPMSKAC